MSTVKIDTTKYNQLVANFNTCVQTFNNSINGFFDNIAKTKGWEGDAANTYKASCEVDKVRYVNFGEALVKYVDTLYALGANIDSSAASER